jgi:hypothetical protein
LVSSVLLPCGIVELDCAHAPHAHPTNTAAINRGKIVSMKLR